MVCLITLELLELSFQILETETQDMQQLPNHTHQTNRITSIIKLNGNNVIDYFCAQLSRNLFR